MIRNLIFSIFFFSGIIFISIIFLPSFFLPKKIVLFGGKLMGYWTGFCLKVFLSTKIIIKGKDNIVQYDKFFNDVMLSSQSSSSGEDTIHVLQDRTLRTTLDYEDLLDNLHQQWK